MPLGISELVSPHLLLQCLTPPSLTACPAFYDFYGDSFAAFGTRTGQQAGGKFLLVPAKYNGTAYGFPADRIIIATTPQARQLLWHRTPVTLAHGVQGLHSTQEFCRPPLLDS